MEIYVYSKTSFLDRMNTSIGSIQTDLNFSATFYPQAYYDIGYWSKGGYKIDGTTYSATPITGSDTGPVYCDGTRVIFKKAMTCLITLRSCPSIVANSSNTNDLYITFGGVKVFSSVQSGTSHVAISSDLVGESVTITIPAGNNYVQMTNKSSFWSADRETIELQCDIL